MYFFITISLLFCVVFGAPQDLANHSSEAHVVINGSVEQPLEPIVKPSEAQAVYEESLAQPLEPLPQNEVEVVFDDSLPQPPESAQPTEPLVLLEHNSEDAHEERPFHKQKAILMAGKGLSKAITAKIVGPVVIFNSKVAAAAGALPVMLAAKGAVIGSAIATPIEIGALASSAVVSGVTGKLVAIPITIGAGALAKLVTVADKANGFAENGRQIWEFNAEHGHEILKDGVIKMGHIILKPIAVIAGAQTALNGAGLGIVGSGIKKVGVKMEVVGAKMLGAGLVAKGLGHHLIKAQFPPYL